MDGRTIDRLARAAGTASSRRRLLGGLGAVVGALALGRAGESLAKSGGNGHGHKGGNSDCAKFCKQAFKPGKARGQCVKDGAHGNPDGLCIQCEADITRLCNGTCCPSGQTCCNDVCVDLATDAANCGGCGVTCAGTCTAGECVV